MKFQIKMFELEIQFELEIVIVYFAKHNWMYTNRKFILESEHVFHEDVHDWNEFEYGVELSSAQLHIHQ